jgi:hypothetical protein
MIEPNGTLPLINRVFGMGYGLGVCGGVWGYGWLGVWVGRGIDESGFSTVLLPRCLARAGCVTVGRECEGVGELLH